MPPSWGQCPLPPGGNALSLLGASARPPDNAVLTLREARRPSCRRMECLCLVSPYGVPLPCLHSVRTASPQPCFSLRRACRRVRPHRSTIGRLPSGASASLRHRSAQRPLGLRGRCGARLARARWRLWDGSPLRHRGFRFSRDAQSIRECALHGLVDRARPLSLRPATPPRGVLRIPAQNPLWPRGQRRPSRPRYSQNVGASVAACTSRSAPSMSFAPSWRACACLARSEAWRRRHEAEQAQTAGRARRRDCACAARREVFRPSAPLRRRGWIARLTADARAVAGADARAVAGGAPPQRLRKLSADRMCWAGNAAAVSRARCARSAGLRRTRIPMAIFRLSRNAPERSGGKIRRSRTRRVRKHPRARTQQDGAYRMAGEVA